MAKITFTSILTGFRTALGLNTNFQAIATELNDKVLYRDPPGGEENTMKVDLDMNSQKIINLPIATLPTEAARFSQISSLIAGGSIPTQDEGTTIVQTPSKLNFVGAGVDVTAVGGDTSTITIPSGATPVQEEGSEILAIPSAINFVGTGVTAVDVSGVAEVTIDAIYDLGFFIAGTMTDDEIVGQYTFTRAAEYLEDFAGAEGDIGTNPTAILAIDIKKNGTSIGDISVSTSGVFTFNSDAAGVPISFAIGDKLEFVNQATTDITAADLSFTFKGIRI